jgi:HK97 family phage major capsid protein
VETHFDYAAHDAAERAHQRLGDALRMLQPRERPLSLATLVRGLSDGTFRHRRSPELDAVVEFEERTGPVAANPDHACKLPPQFLMARALTVSTSTAAGFLVATLRGDYIPLLVPWHPTVLSRIDVLRAPPSGGRSFPVGGTQVSTTWQTPETGVIAEQTQQFGQANSTPHSLTCFLNASRLLLLQSDASEVLASELMRAASTALLEAIIAGPGTGGAPHGILGLSGVGTASGASLAYPAIVAAEEAPATNDAVVDPSACAWITTPAVASLLKTRYISSANVEPIWRGAMPLGQLDGIAAEATTAVPAGTALYGDWSSAAIVEYPSAAQLEVDPFTNFKTGLYGMRFVIFVDVIAKHPESFYVLTSIT